MREFGFLEPLVIGLEVTNMSVFDRNVEVSELQVTLDTVRLYAFVNNVVPGPSQLPKNLLHVFAEMLCNVFLAGYTANHLTTVATGCTPPYFVGLNDMHIVAPLGQV